MTDLTYILTIAVAVVFFIFAGAGAVVGLMDALAWFRARKSRGGKGGRE